MIRLLVIDDHPSTATGLAALLDRETDIDIIGVAGDVEAALRLAGELNPSVVLCDVQLQGEPGGFEVLRGLRDRPDPPAVVLPEDRTLHWGRVAHLGTPGRPKRTRRVNRRLRPERAGPCGRPVRRGRTDRQKSEDPRGRIG